MNHHGWSHSRPLVYPLEVALCRNDRKSNFRSSLCLPSVTAQVAKHRRDFELEVANKEFDNALQMTTYDAEENLRTTEERIRLRIQEGICALQVERAMAKRTRQTLKTSGVSGGGECLQRLHTSAVSICD